MVKYFTPFIFYLVDYLVVVTYHTIVIFKCDNFNNLSSYLQIGWIFFYYRFSNIRITFEYI